MAKNPECWAIFSLTGKDLDPDEITDLTGVNPDFFSSEQITGNRKGGIWQVYSRLEGRREPEEFIWDVLKKIASARDLFKKLCKDYEAVIYCSVEFSGNDIDGVKLSPRLMLILGDLGVSLEFHPWKHES